MKYENKDMKRKILMNLYIWSHSTNEYDKFKFIEYPKIRCIGGIPDYTLGDYVHFRNMTYHPEIHHRVFILNRIPAMYITPPLIFMTERFVSFTRLFV